MEYFGELLRGKPALYLTYGLLAWNLLVWFLFFVDKQSARREGWRVRERTLLLCAVLLGGAGAWAGMRTLRHKTLHTSFRVLVPLGLLVTLAALACLIYLQL